MSSAAVLIGALTVNIMDIFPEETISLFSPPLFLPPFSKEIKSKRKEIVPPGANSCLKIAEKTQGVLIKIKIVAKKSHS